MVGISHSKCFYFSRQTTSIFWFVKKTFDQTCVVSGRSSVQTFEARNKPQSFPYLRNNLLQYSPVYHEIVKKSFLTTVNRTPPGFSDCVRRHVEYFYYTRS